MRKEAFGLEDEDHPGLVTILRTRLQRRWSTAEQLLSRTDGPWLVAGEAPTLADLAATPLAVRLPAWKPELVPDTGAFPLVDAWLSRLRDRPSSAQSTRAARPPAISSALDAQLYMSEPGVVRTSPVSSQVFSPERIIGQPP